LQFSMVEEGIPLTGKQATPAKPKAKKKKGKTSPARSLKARKRAGTKGKRGY